MSDKIQALLQTMRALTFLGVMMTVTSGLWMTQFISNGLLATFTTGAVLAFLSLVGYQVIFKKYVERP